MDHATAAEVLRSSRFFSADWYGSAYPDVRQSGLDPALHYLLYGARLGRDPGPDFDTKLYCADHPEAWDSNPLLHFLSKEGERRPPPAALSGAAPRLGGAAPDPLAALVRPHFDAPFYFQQGVDVPPGMDPVDHYLEVGWRLGFWPNRWFDPNGYAVLHRQVAWRGMIPFVHYLRYGLPAGSSANPYFEERFHRYAGLRRPGAHEYGPDPLVLPFDGGVGRPDVPAGRICIHVHAFYTEMLGQVRAILARVPAPFTFLVSVPEGRNAAAVRAFLESGLPRADRVVVRNLPNRGRDVAPWVVDFRDEILAAEIFCHFHTKQSIHAGDHQYWFRFLSHSILGSEDIVSAILEAFAQDPSIGVIAPGYWPMLRRQPNFGKAKPEFDQLMRLLGARERHDLCPDYPAGSFFWCRTRALEPLLRAGLTREDFPEERGQICGTLAHAIERAIGALSTEAGLRTVFVSPDLPHELVEQTPIELAFEPGELDFGSSLTVSVIVPTWNRLDSLVPALESAFAQSFPPKEVIVVDDGSTDGTIEFLRRTYPARRAAGSLKLIPAKHQGVSAARNAGLDAATGDIIAFLDSDNAWRPDYLAHVVTAYGRHPNALCAYADLAHHDADRKATDILARPYDRAALLERNFIDLNVFSHRRTIARRRFDIGLKRLVDWDYIIGVTSQRAPLHIGYVGVDYHLDAARLGNITHTVPLGENMARVRRKHRSERVFHGSEPMRFAIKCPAPFRDAARGWGDLYFANSLCAALERLGCRTRIDLLEAWDIEDGGDDDVVVVLRGLSAYKPKPRHINFMWHISHPDKVGVEEMRRYDHVFVASYRGTQALHGLLGTKVSVLLQCADPEIFHPGAAQPGTPAHDLLFVGNSRGVDRWLPSACLERGLPLAVYGRGWENRLPGSMVLGEHVPNHRLGAYYSSAGIVLNDHWPDMARRGFVSNRIFDAGLAGAFVISDDFAGKEMFYGSVVTCADAEDLEAKARHFLENAEARQALADRLRRIVLAAHTFDHRARDLLRVARRTLAFRLGLPVGVATTNVDAPVEQDPRFDRAGA